MPVYPQPPLPHPYFLFLWSSLFHTWHIHTELSIFTSPHPHLLPPQSFPFQLMAPQNFQLLNSKTLNCQWLLFLTPHEIQWLSICLRVKTKDLKITHKILHDLDPLMWSLATLSHLRCSNHSSFLTVAQDSKHFPTLGPLHWHLRLSEILFLSFPTYPHDTSSFPSCPSNISSDLI